MKTIFLLFLLFLFVYAEDDDCHCRIYHKKRILHGRRSSKNSIPWVVSLAKNDEHFCGGTIINKRLILTAGHCVANLSPEDIKVRAAVHWVDQITSDQIYNVQKIHMNNFKTTKLPGDIAILELSKDLDLKKRKIEKACFNLKKQKYPEETTSLIATGWGHIGSTYIDPETGEEVTAPNARRLRRAYYEEKSEKCQDFLICLSPVTEGDSICSGDGGSSLLNTQNGFTSIEGVASHVSPIVKDGVSYSCGGDAGYARLSYYSSWFKKIVGKDFCNISAKRGFFKTLFN